MKSAGIKTMKPTLRSRFFSMVIIFAIIPILLISFSFIYYLQKTNQETLLSSAELMAEQMQITIEKLIKPIDRLILSYAADKEVMQIISGKPDQNETFSRFLRGLCYSNEDLFNIMVYLDDNRTFSAYGMIRPFQIDEESLAKAAGQLRQDNVFRMVLRMPEYRYYQSGSSKHMITLVRLVFNEKYQPMGYAVAYIRQNILRENLDSVIQSTGLSSNGANMLIFSGGEVLFQSDEQVSFSEGELASLASLNRRDAETVIGGRKAKVFINQSDYTGLTTAVYIGNDVLSSSLRAASLLFVVALVVMVIIWFAASLYFERFIAEPINSISHLMTYSPPTEVPSQARSIVFKEIETLYQAYSTMLKQNQMLIEREKEYAKNQMKLEQLNLSLQINPHYFGNVLAMISAKAYDHGMEDVVSVCSDMSATFRYAVTSPLLVSLRDEVDMSRKYIDIMSVLYERPISLKTDIDQELLTSLQLPKVTLQPLLENAIIHSIKYKKDAGNICISARETENEAVVSVSDDGAGIPPTKLERIRESFDEPFEDFLKGEKRNIGLKTVHYRIAQHFGSSYGIRIESTPGIRTVVSIVLPKSSGCLLTERRAENV